MTLYLSGPISGLPDGNARAFRAAERALLERGFESTVCPLDNGLNPASPWVDHMRADITLLMQRCSGVILLPGFLNSTGAMAELFCAHLLGIPVWLLDEVAPEAVGDCTP